MNDYLAESYDKALRENELLCSRLAEETAIVDRIWDIYGRPTYEQLAGRSIYDLINADRARLAEAEASNERLGAIIDSQAAIDDEKSRRLAEAERSIDTLLGMIRHQRDVLRECLPYLNESMAGRRPGRSADDIRASVKALTADSAPAAMERPWQEIVKNATRYMWLRDRYVAADFAYGDPPSVAMVFEMPGEMRFSPDLDSTIDAEMTPDSATHRENERE